MDSFAVTYQQLLELAGCGKTTFLEKLGLNNFFGNIIKTEWISGIDIDKKREAEIQSYFSKKADEADEESSKNDI